MSQTSSKLMSYGTRPYYNNSWQTWPLMVVELTPFSPFLKGNIKIHESNICFLSMELQSLCPEPCWNYEDEAKQSLCVKIGSLGQLIKLSGRIFLTNHSFPDLLVLMLYRELQNTCKDKSLNEKYKSEIYCNLWMQMLTLEYPFYSSSKSMGSCELWIFPVLPGTSPKYTMQLMGWIHGTDGIASGTSPRILLRISYSQLITMHYFGMMDA